ncbi:SRPBCC family protein [Cellulomonas cellasea]|uniref:SRPBCC family protein n=1 Tax=Cellulomonas cellasea TaxID=43670 RepID=UPI0025A31A80|nr:SRPBCC family protein [Cellulomonas cellasea]MDM8083343.1 SRPBCC family protein [Cellulomonas cellasea]
MSSAQVRANAAREPAGREVAVARVLPLPAAEAFALLVDLRHHVRWIPMTRVEVPPGPPRVGAHVTAVSGPLARRGAPGLVDRMRIDRLDPPDAATGSPGVAVLTKLGPILRGSARIVVAAAGPGHSRVTWSERVWLAGLVPAAALVAPVLRGMLALALARVARELRASTPSPPRAPSPARGPGR